MGFPRASLRVRSSCIPACCLLLCAACGDDTPVAPANEQVRQQIVSLAPSANIGHRGTGLTRPGHALPENSIVSFEAAMAAGADGIELDVEITQDGQLIVMHDDDLDRTTDCTGCVSERTFDEIRTCRLLDGAGLPTDERPPTLEEVYDAIPSPALINVELKVFGPDCSTDTTGADALVPRALEEVTRLGGESRTLFSSFDLEAAELVKLEQPEYYSALLLGQADSDDVDQALLLGQDAIHPFFSIAAETVEDALDSGLQVNVWTVNSEVDMEANLDKGTTGIITDFPGVLAELLAN